MAAGTITGVSIPPARERPSRPVLERVLAAAPWLLGLGLAILARLPARARLRRRALQEGLSRVFAAINRRDPWVVPIGYEPDCEIHPAAGFRSLGLADCYRGHAGWRGVTDAVREVLPDVRYRPERLIDLGDRWVVLLQMSGTGRTSGVPTHRPWGSVYHLSPRGRIARQEMYLTWEETLAAAGLDEHPLSEG